eukprot:697922-Prymnesium_polylepis.1
MAEAPSRAARAASLTGKNMRRHAGRGRLQHAGRVRRHAGRVRRHAGHRRLQAGYRRLHAG